MPAVKIIPSFNEVEDREFRLLMCTKAVLVEQLALQRGVEALAHRIIVAIPRRSHRWTDVRFSAVGTKCD